MPLLTLFANPQLLSRTKSTTGATVVRYIVPAGTIYRETWAGAWSKASAQRELRRRGDGDPFYVGARVEDVSRASERNPAKRTAQRTAARRTPRRNPPAAGRVYRLSTRAFALSYQHASDHKNYQHDFQAGVCVDLLADGSVRLSRRDGKPLFKNF